MHKAFTLIELMVVILIFTIVIGAAYSLMTSGRISWYSGDTRIELQEDLRQALDIIAVELSESAPTRVVIGAGGGAVTLQVPVDIVGDNPPGSKMEDTDSDGQPDFYLADALDGALNVRWGAYLREEDRTAVSAAREGRQLAFLLVGDELRRRVIGAGGAIIEDFLLSDDIQGINFTITADQNTIVVTINANKLTIDRRPINYAISTAVYLRNRE